LIVKAPAVVSNLTENSSGAFAFNDAGCSSAGSKAGFAVGAADGVCAQAPPEKIEATQAKTAILAEQLIVEFSLFEISGAYYAAIPVI